MSDSSSDVSVITFNSVNNSVANTQTPGQYNTITYLLPTTFNAKDNEVCLSSMYIYNSVFNIISRYNNNVYQYIWSDGSVNTVTMPDGFYTLQNLDLYLQRVMTLNKHYLIDASGNSQFFLSITPNSVSYSVTLTAIPVPNAFSGDYSGWSLPSGAPALPATATTPQFIIAANAYRQIIGYNAGTYPPTAQSTLYSTNGQFVPQVSPDFAFNVTFDGISNAFINKVSPSSLYQFAFSQSFGSQQVIQPYQYQWYRMTDKAFSSFTVQITNQNNVPAYIQDSNWQVVLLIRRRKSSTQ
jgi:hypothetical protein